MRYLILPFLCLLALKSIAQSDTIYTNQEKIPCTIKEVTPDAIQFAYPGESVTNTLYKNTIQKVVFKSGRVQTFSESHSLATISSITDYPKVTITQVEGETKGLYKIGEVSSSSRGGSVYSNVDRVKERALNKLKMEAVMRGANLIYMSYQSTEGNKYGGYFQAAKAAETVYSGVAYSNSVLNKADIVQKLSGVDLLMSTSQVVLLKGTAITKSEYTIEATTVDIRVKRVYEENSQVFLDATIRGFDSNTFRVVRYDANTVTVLAENKNRIVNLIAPLKQ